MNLLKPDWLCCHISPQPTPLLTLRVLPPALHSQCCAAALLLLHLRVQTQEKTFVVLVVFCNAGMTQSSSSKCWGHYEESRDAALLCDDSWSSLSRVSEMNWLWCGSATSRAGEMRGQAGTEVWGKDWRIRPSHPRSARCNLGAVCPLMAAALTVQAKSPLQA